MSEQPASRPDVPQWDTADRTRKALRTAGIGVQEIADYLEVSRTTVSNWINGRIDPPPPVMRLIAMRCGVSYEWLRHGGPVGPNGPGNGTSAQLRDAESMCRRILTPGAQWGSPTPLTLGIAA